jgi:hypothetical protein
MVCIFEMKWNAPGLFRQQPKGLSQSGNCRSTVDPGTRGLAFGIHGFTLHAQASGQIGFAQLKRLLKKRA